MSKTEFGPAIRSRPVYGILALRPGAQHLVVADGEGAAAVIGLLRGQGAALLQVHIIYMPGPNGTDMGGGLAALGAGQYFRAPDYATAQPRLRKVFADARMGMQVYATGSEGLMGQVQRDAMEAGIPHGAIQMEHRGSMVRRVQCVHCKGITEDVRLDPFVCSHCGLSLFVRDHYSRRHAAFQGVNIDAEDPGQVPAAVERFR